MSMSIARIMAMHVRNGFLPEIPSLLRKQQEREGTWKVNWDRVSKYCAQVGFVGAGELRKPLTIF